MEIQFDKQKIFGEAKSGLKMLKDMQSSKDWILYSEQPCMMYIIDIETRVASRGQAVINFPMEMVIQFLKGTDTLKKLNPKLIQMNFPYFFPDGTGRVNYMQYQGVWPVANRDFISVSYFHYQSDKKFYICTRSSSYPYPQVQGVVRGQVKIGGYIIEKINQKSTKVTYIADGDLKGVLPGWLKNMLSRNQGEIVSKIEKTMQQS